MATLATAHTELSWAESGFIKKIIVIFIENSGTFIHTKVLDSQKRCRSFLRSFKNLDYIATHIFT